MAGSVDPGTQRRKLGRQLHSLRRKESLTQREVAARLEWSLTKIIRIEKGGVSVSVTDLKALLGLYKETNDEKVDQLTDMARSGHGQSWSDQYRGLISDEYAKYLALEGSAASLFISHPFLIPGLLQTGEYATALAASHQEGEESQRMVELRVQRQERMFGKQGEPALADLTFLIGEEALHRWIGGPGTMADQLRHLLETAKRPNVNLRIIPYQAGAHPGMAGSSIMIRLPDEETAVFNEGAGGDLLNEGDLVTITDSIDRFAKMEKLALPADRASDRILEMIGYFAHAATRDPNHSPAEQS